MSNGSPIESADNIGSVAYDTNIASVATDTDRSSGSGTSVNLVITPTVKPPGKIVDRRKNAETCLYGYRR